MPERPSSMGFRRLTPVVKATLIFLGVTFVVMAIAAKVAATRLYVLSLVLVPSAVLERPWTLVSYALVHDLTSPWGIIFDGIVLYFFGSDLESRWGKGKFVVFMVSSVLAGGLVAVLASKIGLSGGGVFGTAALCDAMVVSWGLMNRDQEVFFYFFRVKGIVLVYITLGFTALQAITGDPLVATAAVGGILAGAAWAGAYVGPLRRAYLQRRLKRLEAQRDAVGAAARRRAAAEGSGFRVIPGGRDDDGPKRYLN